MNKCGMDTVNITYTCTNAAAAAAADAADGADGADGGGGSDVFE
jgi:hypothetical protein